MLRPILRATRAALSLAVLAIPTPSLWAAAPAADSLLPDSTAGFFTTSDVNALSDSWDRTQYGRLAADPAMKPFVDDMQNQMREQWAESRLRLGITWDDVKAIAGGEACNAIIRLPRPAPPKPAPGKKAANLKPARLPLPASVVLIDITGHRAEAQALLARVRQELLGQQAKEYNSTVDGVAISVFDPPEGFKSRQRTRNVYFIKDDLLCAADEYNVAKEILARIAARPAKGTLAASVPYQQTMQRCAADAQGQAPQARWFVVPLDFFEARQQTQGTPRPADAPDYLSMLRLEGFEGLQGAGGYLNFDAGEYDTYQRVAVYAPPPFKLAARMLQFPNASAYPPESWMPADVATSVAYNWEMREAFEFSSTLVDRIYGGKDILADSLESMRDDPDGPKVDLRKGIIDNLGTRAWIAFDYLEPITETSEQRLLAAEITNEKAVQQTLAKYMRADPAVKVHKVAGQDVWQIPEDEPATEDDEAVPDLKVEHPDLQDHAPRKSPPLPGQEGDRLLSNSYVTAARGYLMMATHLEMIEKMLAKGARPLADDPDYRRVEEFINAEARRRAWNDVCLRRFSRTEDEFYANYELTRQGKLPQSQSLFGQMLFGGPAAGNGQTVKQRVDGAKLPPYEKARNYLGPAGWVGVTEKDGWFLVGFTLRKDGPVANAARRTR